MQHWNGFADFAEINMIWTTERRRNRRFYPAEMKKGKKDNKKSVNQDLECSEVSDA